MIQAAIGDTIEIPTLDGSRNVKIQPGTQSGEIIPEDEPCMVFRARDIHAMAAIRAYLHAITDDDDVPLEHLAAVARRLKAFQGFKEDQPARMKTPDTEPADHD